MKAIITSLFLALVTFSTAEANSFGTYNASVEFDQQYAETLEKIQSSKELRKSLRNDRSIAGMTSSDQKWANEFEKIMADNSTDYLTKAYKLND